MSDPFGDPREPPPGANVPPADPRGLRSRPGPLTEPSGTPAGPGRERRARRQRRVAIAIFAVTLAILAVFVVLAATR